MLLIQNVTYTYNAVISSYYNSFKAVSLKQTSFYVFANYTNLTGNK